MKKAKLQFGAPEWLILIGGSIFIVVLAVSAIFEADIRWLHFFQAWIYIAAIAVSFRGSRWGKTCASCIGSLRKARTLRRKSTSFVARACTTANFMAWAPATMKSSAADTQLVTTFRDWLTAAKSKPAGRQAVALVAGDRVLDFSTHNGEPLGEAARAEMQSLGANYVHLRPE